MNLTLRPGTPADAERCGAICHEAFMSIGLYNEPHGVFLLSIVY